MAKAAKAHGSLFLGQLNHPERQGYATIQPNLVSASSVALGTRLNPTPLSPEDVKDVVKRFAYASEVLYHAGYDGVQVSPLYSYYQLDPAAHTQLLIASCRTWLFANPVFISSHKVKI